MNLGANQTASRISVSRMRAGGRHDASALDWIAALFQRVDSWRARTSQRRRLAELPDHLLHDIGLTRADVEQECSKRFWRP